MTRDQYLADKAELDRLNKEWRPILGAPKDGRQITLGWLPNGVVEFEVCSRWLHGHWEGDWTPTHWHL